MLFRLREKIILGRVARFLDRRPNPTTGFGDLFVSLPACAPLKIVQSIAGKNQMRVRINKPWENDPTRKIDNLGIARVLLDFIAARDDVDLAVANQHSAVANDRKFGHLRADARSFFARQSNELRSVEDSERAHEDNSIGGTRAVVSQISGRRRRGRPPHGFNRV
jgi:hypothetical protein